MATFLDSAYLDSGSQLEAVLLPRKHLTVSGDIFVLLPVEWVEDKYAV